LLHALHALRDVHGCTLTAASVDHGLRPEAPAEVALAGALAASLGVPFVPLRVEVPVEASRQEAARRARYAALLACARERGAECIAVGHTLDDQAETVLARLLRGAGIEGLSAITPRRADGVIRPLLDCRRSEVHAYASLHALAFAHDPSNADERYLRVRVRHRIVPLLSAENPQLPVHLASLADDAREAARVVADAGASVLARGYTDVAELKRAPQIVRRWALKTVVEREGSRSLTRAHLTALERMLWNGGQVRVPGDMIVFIDQRGALTLQRVAKRGRGSERRRG